VSISSTFLVLLSQSLPVSDTAVVYTSVRQLTAQHTKHTAAFVLHKVRSRCGGICIKSVK